MSTGVTDQATAPVSILDHQQDPPPAEDLAEAAHQPTDQALHGLPPERTKARRAGRALVHLLR
jgi:hypothetical protein